MNSDSEPIEILDRILFQIIDEWHQRVQHQYITEEESRGLGVEPEVKVFHEKGRHRIKFARHGEIDVTYGLAVDGRRSGLGLVSSVNNKSAGFDYGRFVERLKEFYWRSRNEKPWTDPQFDHFSYGDLLLFEPTMGESVTLDARQEKADIVNLHFELNSDHIELLLQREDLLRDLVETYCIAPLKRIYAETYRQQL